MYKCLHLTGGLPSVLLRGGVMAAVAPRKVQCKVETLYPAGSVVEAATTPSRWDVVRNRESVVEKVVRFEKRILSEDVVGQGNYPM